MGEILDGAMQKIAPDLDVVKRGESVISMTFRRSMSGLTLSVKTHPLVEEFFRNISTGDKTDSSAAGRHWKALDADKPLMVHNLAEGIPIIQIDNQRTARFDRIGQPLVHYGGSGGAVPDDPRRQSGAREINLSFLRLATIGEGAGITFQVKGVFSDSAVQQMRDDISLAAKSFYQIYLKPATLNAQIITQEW